MIPSYCNNSTFSGLGTFTLVVPDTAIYAVRGKITLPTITTEGHQSALVVTINRNGSPMYVGPESARSFDTQVSCTAADTITIVFTSSASVDQPPNTIKSTISISEAS